MLLLFFLSFLLIFVEYSYYGPIKRLLFSQETRH